MTPEELKRYNILISEKPTENYVHAEDYPHGGTLLYGYTSDRETFHVYVHTIDAPEIVRVIYNTYPHIKVVDVIRGSKISVDMVVPDKRAYPDRTLNAFAWDLWLKGKVVPFTTMTERAKVLVPGDFVGLVV